MKLKIANANFSGAGLGNADLSSAFAQSAGISDTTKIDAIRAMYNSCVSALIWDKIGGIAFFPGSTAATQKFVFAKSGVDGDFPVLEFTGNGSGVDGWTPSAGVYALAPFTPAAGAITNLSLGFYNNTAEPVPAAGATAEMLSAVGDLALGAVADYRFGVSRYLASTVASPLGKIGTRDGSTTNQTFPAGGTTDVTRKRLLQAVKEGNTLRLIDDGAQVSQITGASQVPTGGGTRKLMLGGQMNTTGAIHGTNVAKARLALVYWGTLSLTEAVTFNTIVNTFLTAFGRAAA